MYSQQLGAICVLFVMVQNSASFVDRLIAIF